MMIWIVLLLSFVSEVDCGFCTQNNYCQGTCRSGYTYTYRCGFFGWGRCRGYSSYYHYCNKTCTNEVCCPGYIGEDCNTPVCFGSTTCPNNGTCSTPDYCLCMPGYSSPNCSDTDECETDNGGCQHSCTNEVGSFQCSCYDGYVLHNDSISCTDIDECESETNNTLHSENMLCVDINECESNNGDCQQLCINTDGSFSCSCGAHFALNEDGFTCENITERSLSFAVIAEIDSELAHSLTDISSSGEFYEQARHSLQVYFKAYTGSYFDIIVRQIRKYTSLKDERKSSLIVNYTVVYEEDGKLSETKEQLVRGTLKLIEGTKLLYGKKAVQAKLHLPENTSTVCEIFEMLSGVCDQGFQCLENSEGPTCQYIPPSTEDSKGNHLVYIVPVLVILMGIVAIVLAIVFIRKRRSQFSVWSVKYRRHKNSTSDDGTVDNVYVNDLYFMKQGAIPGDKGNDSEVNSPRTIIDTSGEQLEEAPNTPAEPKEMKKQDGVEQA